MNRSLLAGICLVSVFLLTACFDPVWQSIAPVPSGNQCNAITVSYTSTNPASEPYTHIIDIYQVVGAADFMSSETDDVQLNPSTRDGGYASKPEGATQSYTISLDMPVPVGTQVYAVADSDQGPSASYPSGSRYSAITSCNAVAALSVPNLGLIMITAAQAQPVYADPAGEFVKVNGGELWLPADADKNGFDTYVVAEVREVDGAIWVGIFIGSQQWVWVPLDKVTPLIYIQGTD